VACDYVHQNHFTAGGFNLFAADDLIAGPVAAFDQNIGKQGGNGFARREFIKNHHGIHTLKAREDFSALLLGNHRTPFPFQDADTFVAIDADDERVAECARGFEQLDVAGVQQVEASVGEDDALGVAFRGGKPQNNFFTC